MYLEGFVIILSDGRAALVATNYHHNNLNTQSMDSNESSPAKNEAPTSPSSTSSIDPSEQNDNISLESGRIDNKSIAGYCGFQGVWAPGLNNATALAVNTKYRLLAFGSSTGATLVYALDDIHGNLYLSHTLQLPKNTHVSAQNCRSGAGYVTELAWSPDGCAIATAWSNGGLAVWSVFGACLMNTLSGDYAYTSDGLRRPPQVFASMCWGADGYQLWLIGYKVPLVKIEKKKEDIDRGSYKEEHLQRNLMQLEFVKSVLTVNPCMSNHLHVCLQGEDRIY